MLRKIVSAATAVLTTGAAEQMSAAEAAPTALDNALTIAIVATLAIAVIVMVIRKLLSRKKASTAPVVTIAEEAEAVDAPTAPGTAGQMKLNNVEPKTAAMLMAIVANKMGKPINELRFISVKEVE